MTFGGVLDPRPVEVPLRELGRDDRLPDLFGRRLDEDAVDLRGRGVGGGSHGRASSAVFSSARAAAWCSAYLWIHLSWIWRIGTAFKWCTRVRPTFRLTTSPASSSSRRCFITPKRLISSRASISLNV